MRQVESDRIEVVDEDGQAHTVLEMTTYTSFTPVSTGVRDEHPGSIEYVLASGEDVNANPDGTFTVVITDRVLRRT